jgi:hypothetical protein
MRVCPDCRAQNPERLDRCYACGQSLSKRRDGEPLPGERTYPCLNCGAAMTYAAKNCPACGRLAVPPQSPLTTENLISDPFPLTPIPMGWAIEPLPDGTIRLTRQGWRWVWSTQWASYATVPAFALLLYVVFRSAFVSRSERAGLFPPWMPILLLGVFAATGIFLLIAAACAREELRVGPGFLERRRRLFGLGSVQRLSGMAVFAAASITTDHMSRYGPRTYRYLELQNLGKRIRLDSRDVTSTASLLSALSHLALETSHASDDIATLGRYLSARTGWPFHDLNFR